MVTKPYGGAGLPALIGKLVGNGEDLPVTVGSLGQTCMVLPARRDIATVSSARDSSAAFKSPWQPADQWQRAGS